MSRNTNGRALPEKGFKWNELKNTSQNTAASNAL
jgi:hypothetical protein